MPQLSTGNLDAVLTSADGGRSLKFWEFLSYFNNAGYAFPLNITAVSKDAFNALTPDQRKAVKDAADAAEARDWAAVQAWEAKNYDELNAHKVQIVNQFPPALLNALSEAREPVVNEWLGKTGDAGKRILTSFGQKVGRP